MIRTSCFALVLSSISVAARVFADDATDPPPQAYDCGTLALYTLFHLEGQRVGLRDLEAALPAPPHSGFSMKQLRDAARSLGVHLAAVHLPKTGPWDRPALVFTRRGPHGHFLVVRPIGHTGKMVQLIDSLGDPDVLDISDIVKSPEWTGLALIPSRATWPARIGWALLSGAIAVPIIPRLASRLRTCV